MKERNQVTTIDEKRNQNDSRALHAIMDKMRELGRPVSRYELGKGENKVTYGNRTIDRVVKKELMKILLEELGREIDQSLS